jgi:hypothetical protein
MGRIGMMVRRVGWLDFKTPAILLESIDPGVFARGSHDLERKRAQLRRRGKSVISDVSGRSVAALSGGKMLRLKLINGVAAAILSGSVSWIGAVPVPLSAWMLMVQFGRKSGDVYNILWALVFGFATLNILSLVTRRFEPNRNRMSPGELMAVATVVVSVLLLCFEMLGLFHILPLRVPLH